METRKMALIVIDMQEYFRSKASPIVENLNKLISCCKNNNIPVIYSQHGHKDLSIDGGALSRKWSSHIMYGTDPWKLLEELNVDTSKDIIIDEKRTYDAFYKTRLESILKEHEIDTVIISGVMTNLCCETTARSAFVLNFDVLFLSDGTATASSAMHEATLLNIAYGFAKLKKCEELISEIEKV